VVAANFPIKRSVTSFNGNGYSTIPNVVSPCAVALTTLVGTINHNGTGIQGPYPIIGNINPPTDVSGMIPSAERTSCKVTSQNNPDYAESDIAYVPDNDYWGNSMNGHFGSPQRFTSGPYNGKIRPDNGNDLEFIMGLNVVDNMGLSIRNDATLKPLIFTIGLGNVGANGVDLLQRLANDDAASNQDPSKQIGKYIPVTDATGLDAAFQLIASEILRLSM
jgi:hypothetical protein